MIVFHRDIPVSVGDASTVYWGTIEDGNIIDINHDTEDAIFIADYNNDFEGFIDEFVINPTISNGIDPIEILRVFRHPTVTASIPLKDDADVPSFELTAGDWGKIKQWGDLGTREQEELDAWENLTEADLYPREYTPRRDYDYDDRFNRVEIFEKRGQEYEFLGLWDTGTESVIEAVDDQFEEEIERFSDRAQFDNTVALLHYDTSPISASVIDTKTGRAITDARIVAGQKPVTESVGDPPLEFLRE
jgi:hypothetical protein